MSMSFLKDSKLYSILHFKCPFCHEGDFFLSHPYDLKHAGDLHEACPVCHRKYEKEPGFYYGAMFISYAIVQNHGGEMSVDSRPGQGFSVHIVLPGVT